MTQPLYSHGSFYGTITPDGDEANQEVIVEQLRKNASTTDHELIGRPTESLSSPSRGRSLPPLPHISSSVSDIDLRHENVLSTRYAPISISSANILPIDSPLLSPSHNSYQIPRMKIIACGPSGMLQVVQNSLKDMGYSEDDYIILF